MKLNLSQKKKKVCKIRKSNRLKTKLNWIHAQIKMIHDPSKKKKRKKDDTWDAHMI